MIKSKVPPRVIETININGKYFADRRAVSSEQTTDNTQVEAYERRRKNSSHRYTNIDIWV
ncbi:hypothetical protein CXF83_17225 [Shewanella sp. Choline-02u-19]|uniref:hypothetical protein n=1 Tax=unclassified Shewanella TaxID=196818 RepID=UPI000C34A4AE|nr:MULTISPECIES: hypothetical protein [unclassified Shewanella]PKG55569.1 hypothetical protein CXF82_19510 [Shewanella sp. GutDb-MelDb]PKH57382.1 hypothetical protein CXF84_08680 [Shewanella sp. Bg11-22]PKI28317.1 hypothetical protein CXF83_17225 [Shewanella sp. Choline-02u-19]